MLSNSAKSLIDRRIGKWLQSIFSISCRIKYNVLVLRSYIYEGYVVCFEFKPTVMTSDVRFHLEGVKVVMEKY